MITQRLQTINGKININIPTALSEISLGQMIAMESATGNEIPLIPGLTEDVVNNITDYQQLIEIRERILSLAHQIKYAYKETKLPDYVVFGTKTTRWGFVKENRVKVPGNLSIEPAGAYLACRDLIADEINKHIELFGEDGGKDNFTPSLDTCALILAHYFYCPATGLLWNEQRAESFKSEILKLSVQDALPIARYFFLNRQDLATSKMGFWHQLRVSWKNARELRALRNSNTST